MKNLYLLILFFASLLASCNGGEPVAPYVYNSNPKYTKGYAIFYGAYYSQYGIKNNTLSLSLFSDLLILNEQYEVVGGYGQNLFLEDVFISPNDSVLQAGKYTIGKTDLETSPLTFYKGQLDTIDNEIYPMGAYISYYEENTSKSTLKLISDGSFTVSKKIRNIFIGTVYTITCDFTTSDSLKLKGTFTAVLPNIDQSHKPTQTVSPVRKRTMFN